MGTNWFKNLAGFELSDEQMGDIPHPRVELYVHVTYKTIEAGALLGSCFIAPISRLIRGPRTMEALTRSFLRGGKIGALVGLGLGPLMTYMRSQAYSTEEEWYDRAYRLRYNRNQVIVDRFVTVGAVAGSPFGAPGVVVGIDAALVLGALYNSTMKPSKPRPEKKTEYSHLALEADASGSE